MEVLLVLAILVILGKYVMPRLFKIVAHTNSKEISMGSILLIVVGLYETDGNNGWWRTYSYVVDFWLVAVIPVALYPFFGGKVWCRYWCPLAAYNGLLARLYGKLEIRSNDKCISCTQCSRHCQVGVDVMAFAKNAESFDNVNSNCIQCGICVDVCPMDVLSFGQKDRPPTGGQVSTPTRLNVIQ